LCFLLLFDFNKLNSLNRDLVFCKLLFNKIHKTLFDISLNLNTFSIFIIISYCATTSKLFTHQLCNVLKWNSVMLKPLNCAYHLFTSSFSFVDLDISITWRSKRHLLLLFLLLLICLFFAFFSFCCCAFYRFTIDLLEQFWVRSPHPLFAFWEILLVKHAIFRWNTTNSAIYHNNRLSLTDLSDFFFFMLNFLLFLLFVFFSLRVLLATLFPVASFASLLFVLISLRHLHLMLLWSRCLAIFFAVRSWCCSVRNWCWNWFL